MKFEQKERLTAKFFLAGINYKKTDVSIRGGFAIDNEKYSALLGLAPQFGITELFVISTCNRTEIYAVAKDSDSLSRLLCTQTSGSYDVFCEMAYFKQEENAIEHLFHVAAGLDSQILGDYEIVGQLKTAYKFSKEHGGINALTERLLNVVLQCSKSIRTNTQLSGGTVSVSFAAVQYIRDHCPDIADRNILLLGTGAIGRNTCKNLVDYLNTTNITLTNRSAGKATVLANELGLKTASIDELHDSINKAAVILLATTSTAPVILKSHLQDCGEKLIIDLSIPYNVEASAHSLPNITLVNVDELSKVKDETFSRRESEIPKVKLIIEKHMAEFFDWQNMRRHAPLYKAVKTKLEQLHTCDFDSNFSSDPTSYAPVPENREKIQKVINGMAVKMKEQNQQGCYYIEAINEYIATGTTN